MTNEEARDELVQLANHFNIYGVVREALDMAIKALSAQPEQNCVLTVWGECSYAETGCSECQIKAKITTALSCSESPNRSDTIYRQDAIDVAKQHWYKPDIAGALAELPSAQPEKSTTAEKSQLAEEKSTRKLIYLDDAVEAIEMLLEQSEDDEHDKTWNDAIRGAINAIKHHAPSAQPERKAPIYYGDGYSDGYMVYDSAECPSCGYIYEEGDGVWGEPYCPHCGQALDWDIGG